MNDILSTKAIIYGMCVNRGGKDKKKEIWLSPKTEAPIPTENSTTNSTPPKTSITQRLRNDLGWLVGVTAAIQLVSTVNQFTTSFSPIFTEFSTRFAQNDQPVIHRGWMTGYTTCFARKVIMKSQTNTPKRQRRTARFF